MEERNRIEVVEGERNNDFEGFEIDANNIVPIDQLSNYEIILKGAVFNKYIKRRLPLSINRTPLTETPIKSLVEYVIGQDNFSVKEQAVASYVSSALSNQNGYYGTVYMNGDRNSPVTLNQTEINSLTMNQYTTLTIEFQDGNDIVQEPGIFEISITVDSEGGLERII